MNTSKVVERRKALGWPVNLVSEVMEASVLPFTEMDKAVEDVLRSLREVERTVIYSRFRDYLTFEETGKRVGSESASYMGTLEKKALHKLRSPQRIALLKQGMNGGANPFGSDMTEALAKYCKRYGSDDIKFLGLPPRTSVPLARFCCDSVVKLTALTKSEVSRIRGIGATAVCQIEEALKANGLSLAETAPDDHHIIQVVNGHWAEITSRPDVKLCCSVCQMRNESGACVYQPLHRVCPEVVRAISVVDTSPQRHRAKNPNRRDA